MKEFDKLQQLWKEGVPEPNLGFEEVMARVDTGRRRVVVKLLWHVFAFIAGLGLLIWAWLTIGFATWTSHLAIFVLVICVTSVLITYWKSYLDLRTLSRGAVDKPDVYIARLKFFKKGRGTQHRRSFMIYEICFAFSFLFFSFELYFLLPFWGFLAIGVFAVGWFILSHFLFVNVYIENENDKIQQMIDDLDRISEQIV